ncbi:MAG: hypothetical protein WEC80_00530 [Patescibacteria group bacterium]
MKKINLEPPGAFNETSLSYLIPKSKSNNYFYKNGHASLIDRIKVKVNTDIIECKLLWNKFSPNKSIFDDWDFRLAWHQGYNYIPYFYTLYNGDEPVGFLPLCFNSQNKRYEWWGTNWMEDCDIYVNDERIVDLLFFIAPSPLHLNAVKVKYIDKIAKFGKIKEDDKKNTKLINKFRTLDELLNSFKKKCRYNLKSSCAYINSLNPRVIKTVGSENRLIDKLINMNISQFDTGLPEDESDLALPARANTYRNMVANSGKNYQAKFIEVYIQDTLAAIDFILIYKDIYYTIKGGNQLKKFNGIGNYIIYLEFEDALSLNMSTINSLQVDYGWKHRYFDQEPLYIFEK